MSHQHHDKCDHSGGDHDLGHILPYSLYLKIFISLLVLTAVTVAAAYKDFGAMNIVIAMLIASVKAMLVALFFMHLKYEKPTTWLFAFFPIMLLFILIGLVFLDNPYRLAPDGSYAHKPSKIVAPASAGHGEPAAEHAAH